MKQAEKILFIGKGVRILRNIRSNEEESFLPSEELIGLV